MHKICFNMTKPKIAIVGAGPAGLCLARILCRHGIPVTIFEGDTTRSVRSQGGTLDLHEKAGQAALRYAGLFDEFKKHARYEGEDMVVADKYGKHYIEVRDQDRGRPEIDRRILRDMLLDSLPAGTVRWGCHLRKAEFGALHFDHGTEAGFDLIIGADGAWSKIRSLLTYVRPFYSGVTAVVFQHSSLTRTHPNLDKLIGRGSYFIFGEDLDRPRCLLSQRLSDGSILVYACMTKPEDWIETCGIDFTDAAQARAALLVEYADWAPQYLDLFKHCDDNTWARPLHMLPPGLRWPSRPGVTVVGDAAHVMTPFAGEGVNCALTDAMQLGKAIVEHQGDLAAAVREYEGWMFGFAQQSTTKTWQSLLDRFSPGGIEKFAARIAASQAGPLGKIAQKVDAIA